MNTEEISREKGKPPPKKRERETPDLKSTVTKIKHPQKSPKQSGNGRGRVSKTEVGVIEITQAKCKREERLK